MNGDCLSGAANGRTYVVPRVVKFETWADEWFAGLRRPPGSSLIRGFSPADSPDQGTRARVI